MSVRLITADALEGLRSLPDESVDLVLSSPPYFGHPLPGDLADNPKALGAEATPEEYLGRLLEVIAECRRVLKPKGLMIIDMGPFTDIYPGCLYAVFPEALVEGIVSANSPAGGNVVDPFCGSGTVLCVASQLGRDAVGIDIDEHNIALVRERVGDVEVTRLGGPSEAHEQRRV